MKTKRCISTALLLMITSCLFAQMEQYQYKRELKGVTDIWHKVILPDGLFEKVSADLSDIRIYGLSTDQDTLEAPYLLRNRSEKVVRSEVEFKLLNNSHNEEGYFFTFEVPLKIAVNRIWLDFEQPNFDWRIKLEGSQDQRTWFALLDDYRIVSVWNNLTNFQFTTLDFPNARYQYFRLSIRSEEQPHLLSAQLSQQDTLTGSYLNYLVQAFEGKTTKGEKSTEFQLNLASRVPLSRLVIRVADSIDYYRPIRIQYLVDSVETEKGWKYQYDPLSSGTLSSIGNNVFQWPAVLTQQLKIRIRNDDNRPLSIDRFEVSGPQYELWARFTEPADYYLSYGNRGAFKPKYDLAHFEDKLPDSMPSLVLGPEVLIAQESAREKSALFSKMTWLWVIMAGIIGVLGWFSLKMLKTK